MRWKQIIGFAVVCGTFSACGTSHESSYVAVMVDNHELARPYQRGLEEAAWVQEQFVEGMITRFEAVYDVANFPASVGPVRSVRSYFLEGAKPTVSAIFHIGGSPDALERLAMPDAVPSFSAVTFDRFFDYDDIAPAPHHRFLSRDRFDELLKRVESPAMSKFPFPIGPFRPYQPALNIAINMHSGVHDVTYTYDKKNARYVRENRGVRQASMPSNIVVLETDVAVAGDLGRLGIRMTGSGRALLFRDGQVAMGGWSKDDGRFFSFTGDDGEPLGFREGQVWMIVVDDLGRLTWNAIYEYNFNSEQ